MVKDLEVCHAHWFGKTRLADVWKVLFQMEQGKSQVLRLRHLMGVAVFCHEDGMQGPKLEVGVCSLKSSI